MSSFASLKIGKKELFDFQSRVDPYLMTLFKESDKVRKNRPKKYVYTNTSQVIKRRLDILGFSESAAQIDFEASKKELLNAIEDRKIKNIVKKSTYPNWCSEFFEMFVNNLRPVYWRAPDEFKQIETLKDFMLDYQVDGWPKYNFPCSDIRFLYRMFLRGLNPKIFVTLDYTNLVLSGEYFPNDKLTEFSSRLFSADYPASEKIIILTEGSTDARFIKQAMDLLCPEIVEYYYFFDFDISKAEGGAGRLTATIKSFISSGIKNRIIAVFDNDTAAHEATKNLLPLQKPSNIKIIHLPEIPLAKNYPTLGPTGNVSMNVNGLAGSIELYFGRDILSSSINKYFPIQWVGYSEALKQYQGVVTNKQELVKKFVNKLNACIKDRRLIGKFDWTGMKHIIRLITEQFSQRGTL
jgi:hypothetical protein